MKKAEPIIKNKFGEKLDTWIESPDGLVKANVILVHGFGTSKHETGKYFDDVSEALVADGFRVIRFDFSGYGNSEGLQEDARYSKQIDDLASVYNYTKSSFFEPINIFAQSMGCFVTALTSLDGISKTIMTGMPNSDPQVVINRVSARFGSRPGAKLNIAGISELPRSTGKIQRIGSGFWEDLKKMNPVNEIQAYSQKTKLLIVHWKSDEILGVDYLEDYDKITTLESVWLEGDHGVSKPADRQNFIKVMLGFFNQK